MFRNPSKEDLQAIAALQNEAFPDSAFSEEETINIVSAIFNRSTPRTSFVAMENDKMAGVVLAEFREWWYPPNLGYVYALAVHPDHQGKGLGKELLEKTINTFKSMNATKVEIACEAKNEKALNLYKKRGFLPDHFLLHLPLTEKKE